ncbi:magnesium transporter [Geosporobacter ferrireducens]|uniref:Magnesium transporter MgtE n=2 Tax=Geosporobacter ferrireducens TaxID=1424294 RepID=A0A1D8GQM0_9FIRM|nr:magnesium transporter [Geosporobacter ferrireducens]AOT73230.1 magnesium transporter [Geosporobacter ferrireducens]MTI55458.1 magnesium transporter [Geosporobacter ferrireducens]
MKELILTLLEAKKFGEARKEIIELNEVDIAELLGELEADYAIILFRMLPKDTAVDVFAYLSNEQQIDIINRITDKEIKHIIDELYFDDMIDMLEEMPASVVKRILKHTREEERILINQFLNYPENSAGSLMTIEYVGLKKEMVVKQALAYIKRTGIDKETIYTCYVTDDNQKLEGSISLRKLVISDEAVAIGELMETDVIYAHTHDDQEKIAQLFKKYDLMILPVVDKERRLTGIITIDDIVDVIEQEDTEDFQKMAAIIPSEIQYLSTGVVTLARNRITWLLILMISATFSGTIIRRFEDVLSSVVLLAAFIPMLMNTGGNAGAQSSTLVIRGLALGKIEISDVLRVIWKEFRVSVVVGMLLAGFNFLRIYFLEGMDVYISLTVCGTLFVAIVFAKLVGGILPIIAQRLKLDPAIMASPLITTIVDAVTLIVYFSLASKIMGIV